MAAANENAPRPPQQSAVEIQQEYYEAVGGVDWELYEKKERKYLLQKIAWALFGPPTKEGNLDGCDNGEQSAAPEDELKLQGYELRDEESTVKVFNKICEQAKYSYNGDHILISILRVVCVIPKQEVPFYKPTPSVYWLDLHDKKGNEVHTCIFHVFSIRQCISMKPKVKGCRVYIDHDARVYNDWDAYLSENTLPKCVMVVPKNGEYKGTIKKNVHGTDVDVAMPRVKLMVVPSPALGIGARVLSATDTISTVANIGALAGIVGALAAPAIAPVAFGTAVGVGVATGTYAIVRSSINLADRKKHEQSIGLKDSEARASWINILVSSAGLTCSAAGKLLSWAAASGTNIKILMNAVQFLQYANLGSGFVGVVNSLGDMIYKYKKYDETPTKLEIFQFTTSALFLGIGVMSNRTAQEIVQDAQADTINKMRDSLTSNAKRKMFDKMTAETRRVNGMVQGNADVIQSIKNIENPNEFFGKLARMNKQLNQNKLRISLSPDGSPLINNNHKVGVLELQDLGKRGRDQLFSKYGAAKVTTKNAPTRIYSSNTSANGSVLSENSSFTIRPEEMIKITTFIINLSRVDQEHLAEILSIISADIQELFLLLCAEFIASLVPAEINLLLDLDPHYKVRVVLFIFNYFRSKISVDDSDSNLTFANILKGYIRDGRINKCTLLKLKRELMKKLQQKDKANVDPRMFDDMHSFRNTYSRRFLTIRAGEILKVGIHEILIRNSTIEKLEEWLETYSQSQCDMFLNLCLGVISCLSHEQMKKLNNINPDEDAVLRVSCFVVFEMEGIFDFLIDEYMGTDFLDDIIHNVKEDLLTWCSNQTVRPYQICKICQGMRFKQL